MTRHMPLVSVILPVYNGSQSIAETMESALCQTYRRIELIVVDDGSTDATLAIVNGIAARDSRVRVISQPNSGVARARNRGLEAARGEFVAPLDADDLWDPRKVELQVRRMLETGPETGLVYCWWVWIDENGTVLDRSPHWDIEGRALGMLLQVNYTGNSSVPLFRRSCVERAGGYDESLEARGGRGCEDWDLALKIAERHDVAVVRALLVGYRRRANSMSTCQDVMWRSCELVAGQVRLRQPGLPAGLYRRHTDQFRLYLAGIAFWSGSYVRAAVLALGAVSSGLLFRVLPYAVRLLWRRWIFTRPRAAQRMVPGRAIDPALVAAPLIPYDRIYAGMNQIQDKSVTLASDGSRFDSPEDGAEPVGTRPSPAGFETQRLW